MCLLTQTLPSFYGLLDLWFARTPQALNSFYSADPVQQALRVTPICCLTTLRGWQMAEKELGKIVRSGVILCGFELCLLSPRARLLTLYVGFMLVLVVRQNKAIGLTTNSCWSDFVVCCRS